VGGEDSPGAAEVFLRQSNIEAQHKKRIAAELTCMMRLRESGPAITQILCREGWKMQMNEDAA